MDQLISALNQLLDLVAKDSPEEAMLATQLREQILSQHKKILNQQYQKHEEEEEDKEEAVEKIIEELERDRAEACDQVERDAWRCMAATEIIGDLKTEIVRLRAFVDDENQGDLSLLDQEIPPSPDDDASDDEGSEVEGELEGEKEEEKENNEGSQVEGEEEKQKENNEEDEDEENTTGTPSTPTQPTSNALIPPPTLGRRKAKLLKRRIDMISKSKSKNALSNRFYRALPLMNALAGDKPNDETRTLVERLKSFFHPHSGYSSSAPTSSEPYNFREQFETLTSIVTELRKTMMKVVVDEIEPVTVIEQIADAMQTIKAVQSQAGTLAEARKTDLEWTTTTFQDLANVGEKLLSLQHTVKKFSHMANHSTNLIVKSLMRAVAVHKLILSIAVYKAKDDDDAYVLQLIPEAHDDGNKRVQKNNNRNGRCEELIVVDIGSDDDEDNEAEAKNGSGDDEDCRINCGDGVVWLDQYLQRIVKDQKKGTNSLRVTGEILQSVLFSGSSKSPSLILSSTKKGMMKFLIEHGGADLANKDTRKISVQAVLVRAEVHPQIYYALANNFFKKRTRDLKTMLDPLLMLCKLTDYAIKDLCKTLPWSYDDRLWYWWNKDA